MPRNNEELDLTVPTLPDGVYSVRWTSASAQDGHIMHGFYLFTVGGPGAVAPPGVPAASRGPMAPRSTRFGVAGRVATGWCWWRRHSGQAFWRLESSCWRPLGSFP